MVLKKKIAFVYPDAFSIWIFRQGLARALMARGYDVYAIAGEDQYVFKLEKMGVKCIPVSFERFLSVKKDLQLLLQLFQLRFNIQLLKDLEPMRLMQKFLLKSRSLVN